MRRTIVFLLILLVSGTAVFANQNRATRNLANQPTYIGISGQVRDNPHRDPVEIISYDDEETFGNYLSLPDYNGLEDHSFNVRFTPQEAPFQLIGLQVALFDMDGNIGNPGMDVAVFSSEEGFPLEEITSFEVPNGDLTFSAENNIQWTDLSFADYDVEPVLFEDIADFHIVLNVLQGNQRDTLAVLLDDGEAEPTDRSGFWNAEWEVWDLIEIVYERGYNFGVRAVVEYPDHPLIVVDPLAINVGEEGGEFPINVSNAGGEALIWRTELEITNQPDGVDQQWVSGWEPEEGELQPDESVEVLVTINVDGLIGGLYEAEMHFFSNDPETPEVLVNISMAYTGIPEIEVNPAEIDFGNVEDPEPRTEIMTISNIGTDLLIIEDILINSDIFSVDFANQINLEPLESTEINVTFTPNVPGEHRDNISIVSNDPENNDLQVPVHAIYITPPTIGVDPLIIESVDGGDYELILINEGSSLLEWSTTIEEEWLSIDPSEGQLDSWNPIDLILTIDTTGLEPDQYVADLVFDSNDPVNPEVIVHISLEVTELGINDDLVIPAKFGLNAIYPNPFNSTATVEFSIVSQGEVSIEMFDITGHLVRDLISGNNLGTGEHCIIVEASDLPAGSYTIRLQQNQQVETQTINLVK
ncbi:MAG: choice-of-anchor D domain-containing protein [Calditrichaeota bacterium]|nr:choice-of-anchor D domain-containing protein [Calditrichota bacterium]